VPVLAARTGGLRELVEHGVTGFLFEPGDSEDLAAKLKAALSDRKRLVAMGERGRRRAMRYGLENVGAETDAAFRRLAATQ
jgi:glycosyltransferase involved in cell wall biosynthesis